MVKPSSMSPKTVSAASIQQSVRERFDHTTSRLRKVFVFDVAALAIVDRERGKTQILIYHGSPGKGMLEHKVLEQSLEGEFRLVGGQLVAVSRSQMARDVSFIERVWGVETRELKSGLLLPLPDNSEAPAVLFLGSYNDTLLQARKKISLSEVHTALTEIVEAAPREMTPEHAAHPESEDRQGSFYRQCFDGIDLPAAVLADDLTVLHVNPAFEKVFGYASKQVDNQRSLRDFLSKSERRTLFRQRENRTRLQFEAKLVLRNGLEKTFEVTLQKTQETESRIATFRDLSAIRESTTELREWAERLSVIHGIGEAVNAATSIKEIFVRCVKQLRRISHFEYASLAFFRTGAQEVHLEAFFKQGRFGTGKSQMRLETFERLVRTPSGIVKKLPEPLAVFLGARQYESALALALPREQRGAPRPASTVLQGSGLHPASVKYQGSGLRPASKGKQGGGAGTGTGGAGPAGCLLLSSRYPNAFSTYHYQVLESIGDLLAAGIRKVQLLQETQQNYERLAMLSEVSRSIGQSLNLDQVLQAIARAAQKALDVPAATIVLVDLNDIVGGAVAGLSETSWQKCLLKQSRGFIKRLERNRPILVPELRRSKLFLDEARDFLLKRNLNSYLGAPILINGQPAALLSVFAADPAKFYSGGAEMLSALAAQAAHVLHNARLFEQVKETKDYLENLLKSSVDAIVTTDRHGRLTYFSQGAESMFGLQASAALGRQVADFLYKGASEARQLLLRIMRDKKIQSHECEVLHTDGGKVPVSLSISQLLADDGRVSGFLAIGKDISARKSAELESRRRGEELENFVYLISHNLKTPIVSIQGFANLLQEEIGPSLDKEQAHFLERVQKNATMMEKMIVDLLDFFRIGRPQLQLAWTSVVEIVKGVVDEMKLLEHMRDVEFEIAPDLPLVMADAEGLNVVFQNLLSNAAKYRRPDVPTKIHVGWESQPRFYAFWVQDNGIGMDHGFKDKAFGLFQRGSNTGQIPGTGIGLALVKRIVENHHGLVRIESTPRVGTTVHFTIPKNSQKK